MTTELTEDDNTKRKAFSVLPQIAEKVYWIP